ncbi:hypothetical protein [Actinoplanes xinjiangensis]|uniref:Uncharacterized protein n=1 Tax=Actinoplanes xinjiangensis TaxID=512350 RepID=A0A316FQM3_9ACTN|nr:hypothetical protein [Actinoplanes xinjiangensis]PWK41248.1 hypothetical protein BC793_117115 [Actinoplanes xinjiangensis]GIF42175.1 hypothetical protein Axi01nite_64860 [Actinoplanes xinjiangensis]
MNFSELPEPLRSRATELTARSPIEQARALIHGHVEDACDFDEIRQSVRAVAGRSNFILRQELVALESVLAEPQPSGTLLRLAAWDANWNMDDDPTDEGAARFLHEVARTVREAIEEAEQRSS